MLRELKGWQIDKVLVLCHGNICRSPLAAALATKRFPNASFSSAGFYPKAGRSSPGFVRPAAEQLGVNLAEHRSQCVDARMIDDAQLILIMDIRNYESLKKGYPHALEKTLFLGMLLPKQQLQIKDPYDAPNSMPAVASKMDSAIARLSRLLQ